MDILQKKILEEVKKLNNHGRHVEASKLFNQYFGDNNERIQPLQDMKNQNDGE